MIEPNPSHRASWPKCKCDQSIPEGDLRWGSHSERGFGFGDEDGHSFWSHLGCVSVRVFENGIEAHVSLAEIPSVVEHDILDELEEAYAEAKAKVQKVRVCFRTPPFRRPRLFFSPTVKLTLPLLHADRRRQRS